jgi:2-dehydropantoate 2-reductase
MPAIVRRPSTCTILYPHVSTHKAGAPDPVADAWVGFGTTVEARMRILIMGSGGIGGYYGARFVQAGNDVVFVARGAHLEAMRSRGLELRERDGTVSVMPVQAVRYPAEAGGTFDFILFAVKTYDTAEAAEAIRPVVGSATCIVPIQNGVDSVEEIGAVVDPARVLAGSTLLSSTIIAPGVVQQLGANLSITIGEPAGPRSARVERIVATFHAAGIDQAVATDDAQQGLWEKFMFLAPCASINSATGLPTGHIKQQDEGRETVLAMQSEIRAVGLASGVNLPDEVAERVKALYLGLSDGHTTSMQRDFAAGKRVELESLTGSVVRRGRQVGVPTPIFGAVYAILRARARHGGNVS